MLKLPSYQQLSKEQDTINNLPLNDSFLVIGPPGTGKTVLAIYRSAMFKRVNKYSNFILYTRPLRQYIEQATKEVQVDGIASTFHSWFYNWYRENFYRSPPEKTPFEFDWSEVFRDLNVSQRKFEQYDHLIIDEGQDFPKEFYLAMRLIARNITVFADENQRITDKHSNFKDIQNYLHPKSFIVLQEIIAIHVLLRYLRVNSMPV